MHRNFFSINVFLFLIIGSLGLMFYVPAQASQPGSAPERADPNAPVLFGTIILDNRKMAILEDPSTKVTNLYNINDSLSGYVISDIQQDKIIMKNGGKTIEVDLRDGKNIKTANNAGPPPMRAQQAQPSEQPSSNADAVSETVVASSSNENIPAPSSGKGDPQSFANTFTNNSKTGQNNRSDFIEKFKSLSVSRKGRRSQKTLNLQNSGTPKSSGGGVFGIQK